MDERFRLFEKPFRIGLSNRHLDIIAAVDGIVRHIHNTDVILPPLVPDHKDVVILRAQGINEIPLILHIHAAGRSAHVHMTVALEPQRIKGFIVQFIQPGRILFLIRIHCCARDLLRINQDLGDLEVSLINAIHQTVPGDLGTEVIDQGTHLVISFQSEIHLDCVLGRLGKILVKGELIRLQIAQRRSLCIELLQNPLDQFVIHLNRLHTSNLLMPFLCFRFPESQPPV